MALTRIRQSQVNGLQEILKEITNQIKTFKPPIDLIRNLPLEGNNDGDTRVCLEDSNVYVWNENKWNINTVKGAFSRTKFILISEDNQSVINTGIRFDEVGADRTNNSTINFYLNGVLVENDKYSVYNSDNEMIVNWLDKEFQLMEGDLVGIAFYDITGGLKLDIPVNSPGTNDSNVMIVGEAILPKTTKTVDIGSQDLRFKSIYVDEAYLSTNTLYVGDVPVLGTDQENIVIKAEGSISKVNLTSPDEISLNSKTINLNGILYHNGEEISGSLPNGSGATNTSLKQITKLNVVAPKDVRIQIKETPDFKLPDINVLKLVPGEENVVNTVCDFDNSDSTDFNENADVIFDGTMRPKLDYELELLQEGELYTVTFDKTNLNVVDIDIV